MKLWRDVWQRPSTSKQLLALGVPHVQSEGLLLVIARAHRSCLESYTNRRQRLV